LASVRAAGGGCSKSGGGALLPWGGRAGYRPAWWGRVGWADTPAAMERPVVVTEPYPAPTRVGPAAGRARLVAAGGREVADRRVRDAHTLRLRPCAAAPAALGRARYGPARGDGGAGSAARVRVGPDA